MASSSEPQQKDLELRKASAASIRAKHPDRIPVIVVRREPVLRRPWPFCDSHD